MGTLLDLASLVVVPSGYKEDVVYSVKPTDGSGDLDFTRSNDTATRVNSAGLIEKVRTNLVLQSNTFNNASWSNGGSGVVLTSNQEDPFGGTNGWRFLVASASGYLSQNSVLQTNTSMTVSVWVKSNTGVGQSFRMTANSGSQTSPFLSATTSWTRVSWSFVSSSNGNILFPFSSSPLDLLFYGFQVESGDIATDYIPTTTAPVSVGMTANVPRLDYSGGGCPKLLLEPQRTNLVLYSEQFNNSAWTKTNLSVTANQTTSPAGYDDADLIDALTGTGQHFISAASLAFTNAIPYTFSVFAKKGNTSLIQLFGASGVFGSDVWATYNFDTLEVTVGSAATASMVDYGSGWYRLILTGTVTTASTVASFYAAFTNNKSVRLPSFTAANQTFYLWGAQTEQASYATSYIPTLGAAVTRGADAASKTGISSLIGQTEGTLYWEVDFGVNDISEYPAIFLWDGTSTNRLLIQRRGNTSKLQYQVVVGGVIQVDELGTTLIGAGKVKIAFAYKANDFVVYLNGSQEIVDTSGSTYSGALSQIAFQNLRHDKTSQLTLFPTRLTNTQLAELTTI